ncbi:MAG: DUF3995 domain-containing protein [Deltaproteobacteria bacterium]|nr:DUF3995 domain-containing protein [Deltaproteobacteria bacterium]
MLPGILAASLLTVLSAIHCYWACGGQWGRSSVIPEVEGKPQFHPGKGATVLVALLLAVAALTIVGQLGLWGTALPAGLFFWGTRFIAGAFFLRVIGDFRLVGLFKRVRTTRFAYWDSHVYVPLCLTIAVLTFFAAGRN